VRPGKPFDLRTAVLFGAVVVMWLAEPLHHIEAHWVAVGGVVMLVATRAIHWADVRRMDWQSLVLIAGGIGLGAIMNQSGAARMLVEWLPIHADSPRVSLFVLCLLSAMLAAIMSNTGTAALIIPIAIALVPNPSTAILVALATGLGFPFVISTPANAMAVQQGADPRDLLRFGVPTIILGSALLAFTGPFVLGLLGIP
jgi:sodium-dependent dicarboxylate transporter 2/3/5